MTRLARAVAEAAVLPLPASASTRVDWFEPKPAADAIALAEAQAQIARLEITLAAARSEAEDAVRDAREVGRLEGLAEAGKEQTAHLALIEKAASTALHGWKDRLAGLEGLAALLARNGLAKIFAASDDHAGRVTSAIARQVERFRADGVVAIRVSSRDFPTPGDIAQLSGQIEAGSVAIVSDSRLAAGDCRFDLRLGDRDISPASQWAELERFLGSIAGESARA